MCSTYNPEHSNILGLYNNEIKTVFLDKNFWWASVRDQSILLHELVHHMQYTKNWEHYRKKCKGHIEKEAYDLQEKWLAIRGLELGPTIDLGPLMRHVLTQCDFFLMIENEEVKELLENMEEFFGYEIPSPINFPTTFKYYLKMYREYTNER